MYTTYPTDYDMAAAADRFHDLRNEMEQYHMARAIRPAATHGPSLLDRLFALIGRGAEVRASHGKVGASA